MLPRIDTSADLERMRLVLPPWRAGLAEIQRRHGLRGESVPQRSGTLPVFAMDEVIVKLYAPASTWDAAEADPADGAFVADGGVTDFEAEHSALSLVAGRLPIPTPEVLAHGELDAWRYLVMRKLPGRPLGELLSDVCAEAQRDALRQLGEAVAALHRVEAGGMTSWVEDFDALITHQAAETVAIERKRGAPEAWLDPLTRFIKATPRGATCRSLLHTELGPGHTLAKRVGDRIVLTGLIDFVDAMIGDAEYDFAAVAFFLADGDGARLGAFLDGYGWTGSRGRPLSRRLLRYLLLHRFAPLHWLLRRKPPGAATEFEDLVEPWIGVA